MAERRGDVWNDPALKKYGDSVKVQISVIVHVGVRTAVEIEDLEQEHVRRPDLRV
jgi:hypothetical protein